MYYANMLRFVNNTQLFLSSTKLLATT